MSRSDSNDALLEEYRTLNEGVWRRSDQAWLVTSIMVPIAFAAPAETIINRKELGQVVFANLPVSGFIPLVLLLFIIVPGLNFLVTDRINGVAYERIHELE